MRILWHSNAPWCKTGYGQQTATFVPRIAEMGHEIAVSAFYGLQGAPIDWQGIRVYPNGQHAYGGDVIGQHARHFKADYVITLMDQWALPHETLAGLRVANWMPVDCGPALGQLDFNRLETTKAQPIAFSRHGEKVLKLAGFEPMYVPHGIDTKVFRPPDPPDGKTLLRKALKLDDRFVIFMNAANMDKRRKGFAEQFAAFSRFHHKHPEALLMVHTIEHTQSGLDLPVTAARMGAHGHVAFAPQYEMTAGLIDAPQLAASYGAADVFSGCALAEGFGLPIIEAQACGVPVVVTDGSAMSEVGAPGWLVKGEMDWQAGHDSWWTKPSIDGIVRAYEKAFAKGASYDAKCRNARAHALEYDADKVAAEYWKPALEELEGRL